MEWQQQLSAETQTKRITIFTLFKLRNLILFALILLLWLPRFSMHWKTEVKGVWVPERHLIYLVWFGLAAVVAALFAHCRLPFTSYLVHEIWNLLWRQMPVCLWRIWLVNPQWIARHRQAGGPSPDRASPCLIRKHAAATNVFNRNTTDNNSASMLSSWALAITDLNQLKPVDSWLKKWRARPAIALCLFLFQDVASFCGFLLTPSPSPQKWHNFDWQLDKQTK